MPAKQVRVGAEIQARADFVRNPLALQEFDERSFPLEELAAAVAGRDAIRPLEGDAVGTRRISGDVGFVEGLAAVGVVRLPRGDRELHQDLGVAAGDPRAHHERHPTKGGPGLDACQIGPGGISRGIVIRQVTGQPQPRSQADGAGVNATPVYV
jgi:hypothetical protein